MYELPSFSPCFSYLPESGRRLRRDPPIAAVVVPARDPWQRGPGLFPIKVSVANSLYTFCGKVDFAFSPIFSRFDRNESLSFRGRKSRVKVVRSMTTEAASRLIVTGACRRTAFRRVNCVVRKPTGRRTVSYNCVTARVALRRLKQAHS